MSDRIQNASVLLLARFPLKRAVAVAEQAFENDLRIDLHGKRFSRRFPRDRVDVRATVSVIADARVAHVLDSKLN
jgi:hypothetical protein